MEETLSPVELNIPVWIKLFAGGIGVILLFSLFTLPGSIFLGLHLEKGKRAVKDKRYNTAEAELFKVLEKAPDNVEAKGLLLIAAFHNQDYITFSEEAKKLQNIHIKNSELLAEINSVMTRSDSYGESNSSERFKAAYPDKDHIPDTAWMSYRAACDQ